VARSRRFQRWIRSVSGIYSNAYSLLKKPGKPELEESCEGLEEEEGSLESVQIIIDGL